MREVRLVNALRIAIVTAVVVVVVSTLPSFDAANEVVGDTRDVVLAATATTAATPTVAFTATPRATADPHWTPTSSPEVAPAVVSVLPSMAVDEDVAPSAAPSGSDPGWLTIPRIGVSAPVVLLPLRADGTMPAPASPLEVGSYTFAAKPGEVGNVVLAGHVDFANYGAAVFYRLRELHDGDEVVVTAGDGTAYTYRVSSVVAYEEATAPVMDILGPTSGEVVTIITCAGTFDPQARAYDQRLVVRADRVA
ncbi:MAG: class F sortase [Dehalococcoidia bacterium]